jgi:hypothetical protein
VAADGVTSNSACVSPAVSARCMATPPMTHVGQATMEPAAMPATAPTMIPANPP